MSRAIDRVNNAMPLLIKKTTEEYEAIFGKEVFTESSSIVDSEDYNCGAICNELEYLRQFINDLISYYKIDDAEDIYLDILVNFFLDIARLWQENDVDLKNRFFSIIRKNGNLRWDTAWAIKDTFSYFFDEASIFIEEGYIETTLLLNGLFEDVTGGNFDNWTKSESGSSTVTVDVTEFLEGTRCAKFDVDSSNSSVSLSQTVSSVAAGDYKLAIFYKDDDSCPSANVCKVSVQRSGDSYYFNFDTEAWQSGAAYKEFVKSADVPSYQASIYGYVYGWAYIDNEDTRDLTIKIENAGSSGTAYAFYVDVAQFGEMFTYGSFKVGIFISPPVGDYMYLWDGPADDTLVDRGECEDTTSPMISPETVPALSNATWVRSSVQAKYGTYSYLFTKTVASGTAATVDLVDNNLTSDLHGLSVSTEYSFTARIYIPSGGILGSEIKIQIQDYQGSWETSEQACANTYDAWQYVKVTRTIRASATGVIVRIQADSTADNAELFYVDDVRIVEGDAGNLEYASFLDSSFMSGPGGAASTDFYNNLLEIIKPKGFKAVIEYNSRG